MTKTVLIGTLAVAGLTAGIASAQTLNDVVDRGTLRCGSNEGLAGFAAPDANGVWEGFDVALCRAIAAAVLGDGQSVEFVPLIPEVLVHGDQFAVIRKRPSYEEMIARDSLPEWLE